MLFVNEPSSVLIMNQKWGKKDIRYLAAKKLRVFVKNNLEHWASYKYTQREMDVGMWLVSECVSDNVERWKWGVD